MGVRVMVVWAGVVRVRRSAAAKESGRAQRDAHPNDDETVVRVGHPDL